VLGPTASGKSDAALLVAKRAGAAILSVDSMQVYRGMDIGTAKPSVAERAEVVHHGIDLADPEDTFTVAEFQAAGRAALAGSERPVLIVGGSGLHFRSVVDPLRFPPTDPVVRAEVEALRPADAVAALVATDPDAARYVDLSNPRRVVRALEIHRISGRTPSQRAAEPEALAVKEYRPVIDVVAVAFDPGERLPARVGARFDHMLGAGLLGEVRSLAPRLGPTARHAVGYRQLVPVVSGEWTEAEGRRRAVDATTALARRQRTFFRRDPRIRWLEWDDDPERRADAAQAALEEAGWTS
jgi:tRNA dimethylallyltransferase